MTRNWISSNSFSREEEYEKGTEELKLTIELVPSTSWYSNLRKYLSKEDWDRIRRRTYAEYGYRCGICEAEGTLYCHEIWEYDDKQHIQRLVGLIALCKMCHHVKHIGLAEILSMEGKLDYEEVVFHFMKVNNCDKRTFEKHRERAFDEWYKRSQHEWRIDLGEFKDMIQVNYTW